MIGNRFKMILTNCIGENKTEDELTRRTVLKGLFWGGVAVATGGISSLVSAEERPKKCVAIEKAMADKDLADTFVTPEVKDFYDQNCLEECHSWKYGNHRDSNRGPCKTAGTWTKENGLDVYVTNLGKGKERKESYRADGLVVKVEDTELDEVWKYSYDDKKREIKSTWILDGNLTAENITEYKDGEKICTQFMYGTRAPAKIERTIYDKDNETTRIEIDGGGHIGSCNHYANRKLNQVWTFDKKTNKTTVIQDDDCDGKFDRTCILEKDSPDYDCLHRK